MKITAIIILNYNDWKTTVEMLSHIKTYSCLDYIIIVDNCSTNNSLKYLQQECNQNNIKLLVASKNRGYAAGNNIGIRYAINELHVNNIIISNPDIICKEEDMIKIIETLKYGYSMATGVVYNKNINGDFKIFSSFGWYIPNYFDLIINNFLIAYKINRYLLKRSIYHEYKELKKNKFLITEAVSGCFFVINSKVLDEIGLFDERTFLYFEENILGYKLKEKGYKVAIRTDANVYHNENLQKNSNLKKIMFTYKITLNSADIYLRYYLKKSTIAIKVFHFCFWIGKIENLILKKLLRK